MQHNYPSVWKYLLQYFACNGDNKIARNCRTEHWSCQERLTGQEGTLQFIGCKKKCLLFLSHWPYFGYWLLKSELAFDSFPSSEDMITWIVAGKSFFLNEHSEYCTRNMKCLCVSSERIIQSCSSLALPLKAVIYSRQNLKCPFSDIGGRWEFLATIFLKNYLQL